MKSLVIVNVGQAPKNQLEKYGDFELWAKRAIGEQVVPIVFHDGVAEPLPNFDTLAGVIIMGSLAMVTEQTPWMKRLGEQIVALNNQQIPLLGICFGHQLIADALGGRVDYNPRGLEIGTIDLERSDDAQHDALFASVSPQFKAQAVHFQSVLDLPPHAVRLAKSAMDDNHAFRVGENTWGVQFHPEFTPDIMHDSLSNQKDHLGDEYASKVQCVTDTEQAKQILVQFAQLCAERT